MKYLYKVLMMAVSLVLTISFCGCGSTSEKTPSQVVTENLDYIKNGNHDIYKDMFKHGLINIESDKSAKDLFPESSVKIDNALSRMTYTINSEKINGDKAVVNVTLTGPELDSVFSELVKDVRSDFSNGLLSLSDLDIDTIASRYDKLVSGLLDDMNISERTMDIKLVKNQGEWELKDNDNIIKITVNIHPDEVQHVIDHI